MASRLGSVMILLISVAGCASIQFTSADGLPHVWGAAFLQELDAHGNGRAFRVIAPVATLRAYRGLGGWALGLDDTLLFFVPVEPAGLDHAQFSLVAVYHRAYGLAVGPGELMVGYGRQFEIFMPASGSSIVQNIGFSSEGRPMLEVDRKEAP